MEKYSRTPWDGVSSVYSDDDVSIDIDRDRPFTAVERHGGVSAGNGPVVLVSMPFGPLYTPSIALGLLSAELRKAGFATESHYFTVSFARRIGAKLYQLISSGAPGEGQLFGDWLFRDALFGPAQPVDDAAYLKTLENAIRDPSDTSRWKAIEDILRDATAIRSQIDGFLDDCAAIILADKPMLVGFTTVFQQNVASLALARRLKRKAPDLQIAFGGANCEKAMGQQMVLSFPHVDYVVSGEGEKALIDIAQGLAGSAPDDAPPLPDRGVITGRSAVDMNALPFPDYDAYFDQVRDFPDVRDKARLLFETSRGCWWGERSHCTFCGLNGTSMVFRSKPANRAFGELEWMTQRWPNHAVSVVDNILDLKYFDSFVPMLRANPVGVDLFYEVKANLKKEQIAQLAAARITRIQPGIESLHDGVLKIMKKGVAAIQNIQLLKWSLELGVEPMWNLIGGFPHENPDWYAEMAAIVPLLHHLPPPDVMSPIRLDRFSPLFDDPTLGANNKRPFLAYDLVYAELPAEARFNLAYHFDFDYPDGRNLDYIDQVNQRIQVWMKAHEGSAFFILPIEDQLLLCDLREPSEVRLSLLDPVDSRIYRACDGALTIDGVMKALNDPLLSRTDCAARLAQMAADGAMVMIQGKYLSLAIEMNAQVPGAAALQRFQDHLQQQNSSSDITVSRVMLTGRRAPDPSPAFA